MRFRDAACTIQYHWRHRKLRAWRARCRYNAALRIQLTWRLRCLLRRRTAVRQRMLRKQARAQLAATHDFMRVCAPIWRSWASVRTSAAARRIQSTWRGWKQRVLSAPTRYEDQAPLLIGRVAAALDDEEAGAAPLVLPTVETIAHLPEESSFTDGWFRYALEDGDALQDGHIFVHHASPSLAAEMRQMPFIRARLLEAVFRLGTPARDGRLSMASYCKLCNILYDGHIQRWELEEAFHGICRCLCIAPAAGLTFEQFLSVTADAYEGDEGWSLEDEQLCQIVHALGSIA